MTNPFTTVSKTSEEKMSPYGDDNDSDSTDSFSVMGTDDDTVSQIDQLKTDITERLRKRPRKLNILLVGPSGVGKSAFITSLATALSGHFHEYALSGHHGGETRPITFFLKRFEDCCLDEDYRQKYTDCKLPTLIDMAGIPNESNHSVYEEILRTVLYGRLPANMSIAQAEEILTQDGINELRKQCPQSNQDLKIHRILFVCSATEKEALPQDLIKCVVNTCRPPGTSSNSKNRAIPLYGVMTKVDKVDVSSDEYKALEQRLKEALGIRGSSHRFVRSENYCDDTAPDRCDVNYPCLDIPVLKFFKQLVDPFIHVDFDGEQEDFTHLLPPPPPMPAQVNLLDHYVSLLVEFVSRRLVVFVCLLLALVFLTRSNIDNQGLRTTCARIKNKNSYGPISDLPELVNVCNSLDSWSWTGIGFLLAGTLLIGYAIIKDNLHFFLNRRAPVNVN